MRTIFGARRHIPLPWRPVLILLLAAAVFSSAPASAQDARLQEARDRIAKLNVTSVQLQREGKVAEAAANAEKAAAEAERTLQPSDPLLTQSLNNAATLLGIAGRHSDAEAAHKKNLAHNEKYPGQNQLDLAKALVEFSFWHINNGRETSAEPLLRRAISLREKALGADHDDTIAITLELAQMLNTLRRFAEAETLAKRVVAVREEKHGPNHASVDAALVTLGNGYRLQGRFVDTDAVYQRLLKLREATLGKDHAQYGILLNNIAANYQNAGRFAEAEENYRRALAISEKALGPDHRQVALVLGNFAEFRRLQGHAADAVALSKRTLTIYEKQSGPNSEDVADALIRVGNALNFSNQKKEAEAHLRRALAIQEKLFGPDAFPIGATLSNLSVCLEQQNRLDEALPLQRRALAIYEKQLGPEHSEVATIMINLASVYGALGRANDDEALRKRALAIREKVLGPDHPLVAHQLNQLALIDLNAKRNGDAEPKFRRALAIYEKTRGPNDIETSHVLNNLATVFGRTGRIKEEQTLLRRTLAIREKFYGPEHFYVAQALNNLGINADRRGNLDEADALYRRAVAMSEKLSGSHSQSTGNFTRNLATLSNRRGKYEEAVTLVRRAAALGSIDRDIHMSILSDAAVNKVIKGSEALDESFIVLQNATASAAAGAVNKLAARFAAGNGALAELVRSDQDLAAESEGADRKLAEALAQVPGRRDPAAENALRVRIDAIAVERGKIRERMAREFPDYASLSTSPAVPLPETKALLADDEALVLIDIDRSVFVVTVTREVADLNRHSNSDQADIGNIRALAKRVRASIDQGLQAGGGKEMPAFDAEAAYEIYKETLKKSEELIAGRPKLSVILSGALTGIPPHLLVTSDPKGKINAEIDWLIKRHEITIYPSVSAFKLARTKSAIAPAPKPLMGYANPVFSPTPADAAKRGAIKPNLASFYTRGGVDLSALSRSLPPLPETEDELRSVGKTIKASDRDLRFGKAATETDVKRARLTDYRILYFATHALVAGETAMFVRNDAEPAIALSIPATATEADDGLLTASEIAQLKLNADWVVLSACNTASGDGQPGAEPLSGLARAFFYAGARSLLVSHWEVPSLSAVPLLTGIFDAKTKNPQLSNAGALRQSMLAQLNDAKNPGWSHPAHWAPFFVVGDAK
jgi:CHAT domain-containing protein/Tfp pilus assembly protein PilF